MHFEWWSLKLEDAFWMMIFEFGGLILYDDWRALEVPDYMLPSSQSLTFTFTSFTFTCHALQYFLSRLLAFIFFIFHFYIFFFHFSFLSIFHLQIACLHLLKPLLSLFQLSLSLEIFHFHFWSPLKFHFQVTRFHLLHFCQRGNQIDQIHLQLYTIGIKSWLGPALGQAGTLSRLDC